jgi:hypothetical protein
MKTSTTEVLRRMADYRFMKYAEFPDEVVETECVIWRGRMNYKPSQNRTDAQPIMRTEKGWVSVRRYAWNLLYSQLTTKARLRNHCGVAHCVNPDHHTRTDRFCKFGHALVGDNLHIQHAVDRITGNPYTYERCRQCGREANYKVRSQRPNYTPRPNARKQKTY